MQKPNDPDDYELDDEYDLSKMTVIAKGRYAPHRRVGKNVFVLAPDVARAFPSDEAVNEALRLVLQIAEVSNKYTTEATETLPRPEPRGVLHRWRSAMEIVRSARAMTDIPALVKTATHTEWLIMELDRVDG